MYTGDAMFGGEGLSPRHIARRHGRNHHLAVLLGRIDERQWCDARGPENTDP
jgi:hypothetical protein